MLKYLFIILVFTVSLLVYYGAFSAQTAETSNHLHQIQPSHLTWQSHPALPKEIQVAVVYGDPSKDGPHVMRLRIPAGSKIAPHWHPINENITVLLGSINLGSGDTFEPENNIHLPEGSFASIPAKHHHYAWFTEDTLLQLNNFGRWQIFYVNPKDDPRNK